MTENSERKIVTFIKEICRERGISFRSYSYDFIMELSYGGKRMLIYGYKLPMGDAGGERLADDKSALYEYLTAKGVPCVPHFLFMSETERHYIGAHDDRARLSALLKQNGALVLKPNNGTGGDDVYLATNESELFQKSALILSKNRTMAVSPYLDIKNEYRVIIAGGEAVAVYMKKRPTVTGDGKSALIELIGDKNIDIDPRLDLNGIPKPGETVTISFKHNLGRGASPVILENGEKRTKITLLATCAAREAGLSYLSADIVETDKLAVLELNSGLMLEGFAAASEEGARISKAVYDSAVSTFFGMEN